jgi:hypothetical protein
MPVQRRESHSKIQIYVGVAGSDSKRVFKFFSGFLKAFHVEKSAAEVIMIQARTGFEIDRGIVRGNRFVRPPQMS